MEVLLCEHVNDLHHSLFHLLNCLIITASELWDYRAAKEVSWCPSWSNSLWQGWSCGLVHCPGGNTTDPIWRVLVFSDGISSWTSFIYWPPTRPIMPFQRRWKCIFHWRGRAWLTIWDRVKIPWYSHRLMHWKRVTCELHDSYFCSMTIKHAIPRRRKCIFRWLVMGWYWVGVELLYNSVHRKFKRVLGISWVGDKMRQRKPAPREAGPPGPRLSSPGEQERNAVMAYRVGVNMLQFCSVSNSLSHTALSNKVRGIFF